MKKLAVISLVALSLIAGGIAVSQRPVVTLKSAASVQQQASPQTAQTTSQPATQTTPATQTSTTQTTPTAQPVTVDQLKAEAATDIMAKPNAVQAYVGCFDEIIQRRYQWDITETEMLHRLNSLETTYTNLCVAQHIVDSYPAAQLPPGFRD